MLVLDLDLLLGLLLLVLVFTLKDVCLIELEELEEWFVIRLLLAEKVLSLERVFVSRAIRLFISSSSDELYVLE